uniref:Hypothetical_protein n=1 Tax=Oryza brachyantha TaxID=4533 RepID=G2XMF3_ORYBR|nr:hypothetical_protein [Oryza brachyantha]
MAMDLDEPFDADKGEAALRRLRDADPALYLSPSADLAAAAREASKHLYASLVPFSPAQPPPLSNLLAGPAFDAEQIWSQIELLSRPLVPHLRRQLRRLEQQPPSQAPPRPESKPIDSEEESSEEEEGEDGEGDELELDDVDDEDESGEEEEEEVEEEHEGKAKHGVEDKFFSIKEMKEFVEKGEEEEYGAGAKQGKKKKRKNWMEEESDEEDEEDLDEDEDDGDEEDKACLKMRAKIEDIEKANLEPSTWTMQGEVNASSRPKNSALEVDLDFEHNVRPAPVITEEVTASLEEMIKKRKDDYAQKAGLAAAPLSISDELKKEANALFKRICLKLDALSHFHFAPKPIAPVAVSDAAMLAPEEIFEGKGDVKEDAELTQAERKRRRANKKRRYAGNFPYKSLSAFSKTFR